MFISLNYAFSLKLYMPFYNSAFSLEYYVSLLKIMHSSVVRAIRKRRLAGVTDYRVSYFPPHLEEMQFYGMQAMLIGTASFPALRYYYALSGY